jgi:EF hand domain-containing protein
MGFAVEVEKGAREMTSIKLSRSVAAIAATLGFAVPAIAFANNPDARFESMDANGDGKVSPDEHSAAAARMFEKMDTNADGKVTAAEMTAAHQNMTGKKAAKGEMSAAEKIKVIDTNGDGVLTADEHAAGARTMFEKMDADQDSYLTKAEIKAGHEKYMHKASK